MRSQRIRHDQKDFTVIHSLTRKQDGKKFPKGNIIVFNPFLNKIYYLRDTVGSDFMISVIIGKFITHIIDMGQEKEATDS